MSKRYIASRPRGADAPAGARRDDGYGRLIPRGADGRPERDECPAGLSGLRGDADQPEQHEHLGSCAQPGERRIRSRRPTPSPRTPPQPTRTRPISARARVREAAAGSRSATSRPATHSWPRRCRVRRSTERRTRTSRFAFSALATPARSASRTTRARRRARRTATTPTSPPTRARPAAARADVSPPRRRSRPPTSRQPLPLSATQQTNAADSTARAGNSNGTDQSSDQSQAGSGSGIQTSDQSAGNEQLAAAASSATQEKPTNTNISVRVLSPGNDGAVTQTNSVSSDASATNDNLDGPAVRPGRERLEQQVRLQRCRAQIQTSEQSADSAQGALAASAASQSGAENVNIPVRVLSPGNGGSVDQSNDGQLEGALLERQLDRTSGRTRISRAAAAAAARAPTGDPDVRPVELEQAGCRCPLARHAGGREERERPPSASAAPATTAASRSRTPSTRHASADNSNRTDQSADQDQSGASGTSIQTSRPGGEERPAGGGALGRRAERCEQRQLAAPRRQPGRRRQRRPVELGELDRESRRTPTAPTRTPTRSDPSSRTHVRLRRRRSASRCSDRTPTASRPRSRASARSRCSASRSAAAAPAATRTTRFGSGATGDDGSVSQSNSADSRRVGGQLERHRPVG